VQAHAAMFVPLDMSQAAVLEEIGRPGWSAVVVAVPMDGAEDLLAASARRGSAAWSQGKRYSSILNPSFNVTW